MGKPRANLGTGHPAPEGSEAPAGRPSLSHLVACRTWLEAEILAVSPRVVVALGAVAALAVLGPGGRQPQVRGRSIPSPIASNVAVTVHPSSVLRAPTADARAAVIHELVRDLRAVAQVQAGREGMRR